MGGAAGVFGRVYTGSAPRSNSQLFYHHDGYYSWDAYDIVHAEIYHLTSRAPECYRVPCPKKPAIHAPHGRSVPWPKKLAYGPIYRI